MGRRPKPTQLKLHAGNPGKRKLNNKEPAPDPGIPTKPEWLSPIAAAEWDNLVPVLAGMRVLTLADQFALAGTCQAYAELILATEVLDKEGRFIEDPVVDKQGGIAATRKKVHPAVSMQRDAFGRLKQFLVEFGLSPSSRTSIKIDDGKEEDDPWSALRSKA